MLQYFYKLVVFYFPHRMTAMIILSSKLLVCNWTDKIIRKKLLIRNTLITLLNQYHNEISLHMTVLEFSA
jgi:hypothetical protein